MSRRHVALGSTIAAAALVTLSASPALANTVNHGSFSCGPDQAVEISYNLSPAATSTVHFYYDNAAGHLVEVTNSVPKANTVADNTAQRSIVKWTVTSSATVTDDSGGCQ